VDAVGTAAEGSRPLRGGPPVGARRNLAVRPRGTRRTTGTRTVPRREAASASLAPCWRASRAPRRSQRRTAVARAASADWHAARSPDAWPRSDAPRCSSHAAARTAAAPSSAPPTPHRPPVPRPRAPVRFPSRDGSTPMSACARRYRGRAVGLGRLSGPAARVLSWPARCPDHGPVTDPQPPV